MDSQRWLGMAFLISILALVLPAPATADDKGPTVVIVDENNTDWDFGTESSTQASGQYVLGPGTPPAGTGSAELIVNDASSAEVLATSLYKGVYLRDLTRLEYSTYRASDDPNNILAPSLQFEIDFDLDDGDSSYQGRLVFEPYKSGYTVRQGVWQHWDALHGKWWTTRSNVCPRRDPCTLSELLERYPNAGITRNAFVGGILFKIGRGWSTFQGNVDRFIIGVQGDEVLYDFETSSPKIARTAIRTEHGPLPLVNGITLLQSFATVTVTVDRPLYNPPGDTAHDDVTNPTNYSLRRADGLRIPINRITYTDHNGAGPYEITVYLNHGRPLPNGTYTFVVEGDTSVVNIHGIPIAGDGVHPGTDFVLRFTIAVPTRLPATGFPMHPDEPPGGEAGLTRLTQAIHLGPQGAGSPLYLSIPRLGLHAPIVGVPLSAQGWDVGWLGRTVGWLEGSAFPTWPGNTVLTGHVWDADNTPGLFYGLASLRWGDVIAVHAWGHTYLYRVRENRLVHPDDIATVFAHKAHDWLTLLTCEGYLEQQQTYGFRRMVRAVRVGSSSWPAWAYDEDEAHHPERLPR